MIKYKIEHDLDSPERTLIHKEIIKNKKFLFQLYKDWYSVFTNEIKGLPNDTVIELGSGGGFLKEIEPKIICTDVLDLPTNDMTFSALDMPFEKDSVGGIFMIDTMHHIPDSEKFLQEVDRVLMKNGKMILIEPANSIWGRFIYKNFHHEPFNPKGDWHIPIEGPLSGANGALPWIVFMRDKEMFSKKFPNLKIESIEHTNPILYLLSGGVSRRQIFPNFTYNFIKFFDKLLVKCWSQISMFMIIKITRV